jgi:hypothetical protein
MSAPVKASHHKTNHPGSWSNSYTHDLDVGLPYHRICITVKETVQCMYDQGELTVVFYWTANLFPIVNAYPKGLTGYQGRLESVTSMSRRVWHKVSSQRVRRIQLVSSSYFPRVPSKCGVHGCSSKRPRSSETNFSASSFIVSGTRYKNRSGPLLQWFFISCDHDDPGSLNVVGLPTLESKITP